MSAALISAGLALLAATFWKLLCCPVGYESEAGFRLGAEPSQGSDSRPASDDPA